MNHLHLAACLGLACAGRVGWSPMTGGAGRTPGPTPALAASSGAAAPDRASAAAGAVSLPLTRCFPIPPTTLFRVDGPWSYDGDGSVHASSDDHLGFEMRLPEFRTLRGTVPATTIAVSLRSGAAPGAGSLAIALNDAHHADPEVRLTWKQDQLTVASSITAGRADFRQVTLQPDPRGGVVVRLRLDGKVREFRLRPVRPPASSGDGHAG